MKRSYLSKPLLFLVVLGLALSGCSPQELITVPTVAEAPASTAGPQWLDGPDRLIGFGDSITDGFGARDGYGYFQMLSDPEELGSLAARWPSVQSQNHAVSCSTSLDHIRDIDTLGTFSDQEHGWVLLTSGGNDIIHDYGRGAPKEGAMYGATSEQAQEWIKNYEIRLEAVLLGFKQRFPGGCDVFLGNIYDPTDGLGDIENAKLGLPAWPDGLAIHTAYNQVIERTAKKFDWVHLVDIHSVFLGHGIHHESGVPYWYYANLEDPNDEGYEALRALFLKEMEKVALQRGWIPKGGQRTPGSV